MSQQPEVGVPTCYRHPDRETYISCQHCGRPICPDCMRQASVGFQCPTCVAEGKRATRSGRTAYGGQVSANPALTAMVLIALNAAVWLLITATGGAASAWVERLALRPEGVCGAGNYVVGYTEQVCRSVANAHWFEGFGSGDWWTPLTSMFTHVEIIHIGVNMLSLWFLGPQLELVLGRTRFLALYLLSGLAGSLSVLFLTDSYVYTLGASGAIFGLLGALVPVVIKVRGNLTTLLTWLGINLVITFTPGFSISWQGHLGGLVGGLVIGSLLVFAPRTSRTLWQSLGLGLIAVVLAGLFVLRYLQLA